MIKQSGATLQTQPREFSSRSFSKSFQKKLPFMACHTLKALEGLIFSVLGWSCNTNVELFRSAGCLRNTLWSVIVLSGFILTFCLTFMAWKVRVFTAPYYPWCGDWRVLFVGLAPEPCVHLCGSDTDRKHPISLRHSLPQGQSKNTQGLDAISNSLEGGSGFEKIPNKESLLSAVLDCSFTKNNRETGEVCDRIQVSIIEEI